MKKLLKFLLLTLILMLLLSRTTAPAILDDNASKNNSNKALNFLELKHYEYELDLWIYQLGYDESRNNWLEINKIGALGEHQFMTPTLKLLGYGDITYKKFKKDPTIFPPELQREVLLAYMNYNSVIMDDYIKDFTGLKIRGVEITKAGILAACHLAGAGHVKEYLNSNGNINKKDIFGTSVQTYLDRYKVFDLELNLI